MMRTLSLILLAGVTMMLLGCGLSEGGQEAQEGRNESRRLARGVAGCVGDAHRNSSAAGGVAPPVELEAQGRRW